MDKEKIERLKRKRAVLQEENRLKDLRNRISSEINYLTENNFDYAVYYKHENLNWINDNLPFRKKDGYKGMHDFQIDVDYDSKKGKTILCNSKTIYKQTISEEIRNILSIDSLLFVCHNMS